MGFPTLSPSPVRGSAAGLIHLAVQDALPGLVRSLSRRPTQFDAARGVHVQQPDCRLSHRRHAVHVAVPRYEVIVPTVFARMEERYERSRVGVDACQIGTFVSVASVARQGQAARIV